MSTTDQTGPVWQVPQPNPFLVPWYVVPDPNTNGLSATVVNQKGEQVAFFESISEAREAVMRMNGEHR